MIETSRKTNQHNGFASHLSTLNFQTIPPDWIETAWNGIRFGRPTHWEIARIGKRYIVLADEEGPVLEMKWGPVTGVFSHHAQLKRIARERRNHRCLTFSPIPVSTGWEQALQGFHISGFTWRDETVTGNGVILYCPHCRQAGLIQFIHRQTKSDLSEISTDDVSTEVLSSFRDHSADGRSLFALYDIRALLPEAFQLYDYRFDAGVFELHFRCKGKSVSLYRWGLAGMRLAGKDLFHFGREIFAGAEPIRPEACTASAVCVEWESSSPSWWSRLKSQTPFQYCQVRYIENRDRILGVRMTGKKPIDRNEFRQLALAYELIS